MATSTTVVLITMVSHAAYSDSAWPRLDAVAATVTTGRPGQVSACGPTQATTASGVPLEPSVALALSLAEGHSASTPLFLCVLFCHCRGTHDR